MAKNNSKSIRLSDEVLNYINVYRGNGFNEKFENIILDSQRKEKERIKRIAELDKRIVSKLETLERVSGKVSELERSLSAACRISDSITDLRRQFENLIK